MKRLNVKEMKTIIRLVDEADKINSNIALLRESLVKHKNDTVRYVAIADIKFSAPICYDESDKYMHLVLDDSIKEAIIKSFENRLLEIKTTLSGFDYDDETNA